MKNVFLILVIVQLSCSHIVSRKPASNNHAKYNSYEQPKRNKPIADGIILYLNKTVSRKNLLKIRKINKGFGFKISKIGSNVPFVVVSGINKDIDTSLISKICLKYSLNKFIKSCFLNFKSNFNDTMETTDGLNSDTVQAFSPAATHKCHFFKDIPDINYEGRSDFWAQEAVGADLVDKEKKSIVKKLKSVPSFVCDGDEFNHNYNVKSIVDGHSGFNESKLRNCSTNAGKLGVIDEVLKKHGSSVVPVNHSMTWEDFDSSVDLSKELRNILWVHTSGNDWGYNKEGLSDFSKKNAQDNFLIVGSLSPVGLPSYFSTEGHGVLISAPSDNSITSCPKNRKKCIAFGGTSGAAPQVTHALKSALEVSPYLTKKQLREIIVKTAIRMPHSFEKPNLNGVGMLNSYKIWKVAKRIDYLCKEKRDKKKCAAKKIKDRSTFSFSKPFKDSYLQENFPSCFGGSKNNSCTSKKNALEALRKAAFLNPSQINLWKVISCVVGQEGFSKSQKFYRNIGRNYKSTPFKLNELGLKFLEPDLIRSYPYLRGGDSSISSLPIIEDPIKLDEIVISAWRMGKGGLKILNKALGHADPQIRRRAVSEASKFGAGGLAFLSRAVLDDDRNVALQAIHEAAKFGKSRRIVLEKGIFSENKEIRGEVVRFTESLGVSGLSILEEGFKDSSESVRVTVLEVAAKLGKEGMPILKRGLRDTSYSVRANAQSLIETLK